MPLPHSFNSCWIDIQVVLGSGASFRYRTGAGSRDGKHGRDGHSWRETRHRGLHGEGSMGHSGASGMAGLVQSTGTK